MAALKKKDEEVKELGNLLKATQEELEMLKSERYVLSKGNWKTQSDGRPRAGLVPKEIASIHGVSNITLPIRPLKQFCK